MKAIKFILGMIMMMPFLSMINPVPETITIAAASDLKFALDSLVGDFKKSNPGAEIKVIYGSSGKLSEQIMNDAPFDLYFSADISYARKLRESGLATTDPKVYGVGRIVLWSKTMDPNKDKLNLLLNPDVKKISIADPAHAPYGQRADESMHFYKVYAQVKDKLVFGENISQAAQFVTTGAADVGIIALSLALSPAMQQEGGKYYLIPEESHSKLEQAYVILKHAAGNDLAKAFYDYVSSPPAKKVLKYYGFSEKSS